MRFFEILLIVFNIFLFVWFIFAKNKSQRLLLIGFGNSAIITLLHGVIEGVRWQMIPAYTMTVVPLVILVIRLKSKPEEGGANKASTAKLITLSALSVIYSFVAVALPIIFPVFTFEKPKGPYKIGTVTYDWRDNQREENLTPESGDKRELMVQIWYPADATAEGETVKYHSDGDVFAEAYSKVMDLPKLLFTTFGYIKTNAIKNVMISNQESSYPVLIFSHGFNGHKNQNTFQIEQLVSHGYIVVSIDHTYSSVVSIFSDGRVANYVPQDSDSVTYWNEANEVWVEDAKFVLDQVEKLAKADPDHRFTGRMDMQNIGMFGHSFGGATATQMVMRDSRIKAAINMDGFPYGKRPVSAGELKKPFMVMTADEGTGTEDFGGLIEATLSKDKDVAQHKNYWLQIKNMTHMGFSDFYSFLPLYEKMEGVNIRSAHHFINDYSLDFFDHHLKQQLFKLLEQTIGEHPEFTLQTN
ncbi:alpha/beta hydrolase family protein [Lysinibacillus sp. NPDC059133]|uniref:alpha/beta hydrolase family protein n=1 Tax=Lysinibacillus sp. NPDC059133 TaxID=3346737 RepID=UPI0036977531